MAVQDPTTNYSWNLPDVGGDTGAWGAALNTILGDDSTGIDAVVKAVSDVANAAMPKAGGTFTGTVENKSDRYVTVNKGSMSGTVDLDFSTGNYFFGTKSGSLTLTFSNPPASGKMGTFILEITNGSGTSWPASVDWPGGTAPTLQASGVDILMFVTRDGGTTWHGALTHGDSA